MLSVTEENYLKALYHLTVKKSGITGAGTNDLAHHVQVKPATANDMLKKLRDKELINYKKYGKITLTEKGKQLAVLIVRKHRLWETFLSQKLEFSWDEVHEVAEQLEHIQSDKLIERLDKFLGFPQFDPHGDAIPNANGILPENLSVSLSKAKIGEHYRVSGVLDTSNEFLHYLEQLAIGIGTPLYIAEHIPFDQSIVIEINNQKITVSRKFADHLFVNT